MLASERNLPHLFFIRDITTMSETKLENIKQLQEKQTNIKIWIGSAIGFIFLVFFFTFAMLVDKFPPIFFIIESIITLILFPCLFVLNRISFTLLKLTQSKNPEFKDIMSQMKQGDVEVKPEEILSRLSVN